MIPPEVMILLQSAQGDYLGGLAATVTLKLVGALGTKVTRRFRPEPVEAVLEEAV